MQQHIAGIFLTHLFHNSWNDYYLIVHLDHVECINDVKHIRFFIHCRLHQHYLSCKKGK